MYVAKSGLTARPEKWVPRLEALLLPGEVIRALCTTANVTTKFDGVAVTNMRIGTFHSMELKSGKGFSNFLNLDQITKVNLVPKKMTNEMFDLILEIDGKSEQKFVAVKAADAIALAAAIDEGFVAGGESGLHLAGVAEASNGIEFDASDDATFQPGELVSEEALEEALVLTPQFMEDQRRSTREIENEFAKQNAVEIRPARSDFLLSLKFILSGARRTKKNRRRLLELQKYVRATDGAEAKFRNEFNQVLATRGLDASAEMTLFEAANCDLIEVRKGARVTHRVSSTSGSGGGASVGFGPVRVGGGSYSSSSRSTATSYPAPDVLQVIDQGKCIITNRKISFVGGKFTKTTAFLKIVDCQVSDDQLLIAPASGTKVWICEFPRADLAWLANILIGSALETDNRLLDSKVVTDFESAETLVTSEFNKQCKEIELAIQGFEREIEKVQIQFRELEDKFGDLPSWSRFGFS